MLEKEIERYFVKKAKQRKCLCYKFVSPGNAGVPDRIIITPWGETVYVELKTPTTDLRPLQRSVHERIRHQNAMVFTLHDRDEVDQFFEVIFSEVCTEAVSEICY